MPDDLIKALDKHQADVGLQLAAKTVSRLSEYYDRILKHNPLLHLVAPGSVEDFAIRHILESLTLLEYLPENCKFADVGTGAGLPGIPCLLAREDLHGFRLQPKQKKGPFRSEGRENLVLKDRMTIINREFEEIRKPGVRMVPCRALDKFA